MPIEGFVLYLMPEWLVKRFQCIDAAAQNAFNDARPWDAETSTADLVALAGEWCDD